MPGGAGGGAGGGGGSGILGLLKIPDILFSYEKTA
jgi:hypothetical protein